MARIFSFVSRITPSKGIAAILLALTALMLPACDTGEGVGEEGVGEEEGLGEEGIGEEEELGEEEGLGEEGLGEEEELGEEE